MLETVVVITRRRLAKDRGILPETGQMYLSKTIYNSRCRAGDSKCVYIRRPSMDTGNFMETGHLYLLETIYKLRCLAGDRTFLYNSGSAMDTSSCWRRYMFGD